jgi:hypothetical protein
MRRLPVSPVREVGVGFEPFLHRLMRVRHPQLLPFRVRSFMAGHWMLGGTAIIWFCTDFWAGVATAGILIALLGSAALAWESVLSEDDASTVRHTILANGLSPNLGTGEILFIYFFCIIVTLQFMIAIPTFVTAYRASGNTIRLALYIATAVLYTSGGTYVTYLVIKKPRVWFHRHAELLQANPDATLGVAKAVIRRVGFQLMWFGALMQAPLTVVSQTPSKPSVHSSALTLHLPSASEH